MYMCVCTHTCAVCVRAHVCMCTHALCVCMHFVCWHVLYVFVHMLRHTWSVWGRYAMWIGLQCVSWCVLCALLCALCVLCVCVCVRERESEDKLSVLPSLCWFWRSNSGIHSKSLCTLRHPTGPLTIILYHGIILFHT